MSGMKSRAVPAAVAVLTALAMSGCTQHVSSPPATTSTATPRASASSVATTHATTENKEKKEQWVEGSWQGSMPKNTHQAQYGDFPQPGITVIQAGQHACTIGPAVVGGFLTAGHCNEAPGRLVRLYTDESAKNHIDVGGFGESEMGLDPKTGSFRDWVTLNLTGPVAVSATNIAGHYPVAGVLTLESARSLDAGTPICLDGAKSGTTCGRVLDPDEGGMLHIDVRTQGGDSGAPVFVVDRQGRTALVGLVKGGDGPTDTTSFITYLEPALQSLGAKVLLDPEVEPFSGKDFNVAVTAG